MTVPYMPLAVVDTVAPGHLVEQVQDGLGQVVRVDGAAGDADDRQPGLGLPVPAQVVRHAHGPGRVARHRVDAAVGGAGPDGEDGRSLGCQTVEPLVGRHRLTGRRVVSEAAPVALGLDRLVRDRTLDHQHERLEFAAVGLVPPLDEVVGALPGPGTRWCMVPCQPLGLRLARTGGARAPAGSGYAVALGHARPFSACLSKSMAGDAGPLTAHHMLTLCRRMATGPSPVTTGYS